MTPGNDMTTQALEVDNLKVRWASFREANPTVRIRDAAEQLGVSEAELVATECGESCVRLQAPWENILHRLESLGPIMALTRNANAVSEKHGLYRNVSFHGNIGLVLDLGIDLRLFMDHWKLGFAVEAQGRRGPLKSFQFFDAHGTALHKVYLTDGSDTAVYDRLCAEFADTDQTPDLAVQPSPPPATDRSDADIDVPALEQGWNDMADTHDFHRLLARFKVGRVQALRLVDDTLAHSVAPSNLNVVLEEAARQQLAIMVFVGNPGVIQIHSGPVSNIKRSGPWLNVLDDSFNLHLREDHVHSAWVVRKPTEADRVSSLEVYDAQAETIALLFAKRKEGQQTSEAWQSLLSSLSPTEQSVS